MPVVANGSESAVGMGGVCPRWLLSVLAPGRCPGTPLGSQEMLMNTYDLGWTHSRMCCLSLPLESRLHGDRIVSSLFIAAGIKLPPCPEGERSRVWGLEGGSALGCLRWGLLPEKGEAGWEAGHSLQWGLVAFMLFTVFLMLSICLPWPREAWPCQEEMRLETIIR